MSNYKTRGQGGKKGLIQQVSQFYECPLCDYSSTKHGESNRKWADMIERMHRKKCKRTGRTTYVKSTDEKRQDHCKQHGIDGMVSCATTTTKNTYSQNIPTEYPEDSLKVPDYEKHLLDKKCIFCGVGHMKKKTPNGKYHQLHEMVDGKYCCDGECAMEALL